MIANNEIIFSELPGKDGKLGHILLNRPQTRNVIRFEIFDLFKLKLLEWQNDPQIRAVIIQGAGDHIFSAGGDLREMYQYRNDKKPLELFFRTQYQASKILYHFTKPYIALWDGLTLGAGIGISMYGSHRVATERLSFAMPETRIGFVPAVGGGYFLPRCPNKMGYYLGLAGHHIGATDAQHLGLSTHLILSDQKNAVIAALTQTALTQDPFGTVSEIIHSFRPQNMPLHCHLKEQQEEITYCFSGNTIEEILDRLKKLNNEWAQSTYDILLKQSPIALKVTLEQLKRGETMEFDDIMDMELNISVHLLRTTNELCEGIRALMIDKDRNPHWQPATIAEVTKEQVDAFFVERERL